MLRVNTRATNIAAILFWPLCVHDDKSMAEMLDVDFFDHTDLH